MAKAVSKKEEAGLPVDASMFEEYAGQGKSGSAADYMIPFLATIESLSPQRKKNDEKYINGAEEGMIFNSVTEELWNGDDGVFVVPCYFENCYMEWLPERGGLVGRHPLSANAEAMGWTPKDKGGFTSIDGNDIHQTNYHYMLHKEHSGIWQPAIIALAGTRLRTSRLWNSLIGKPLIFPDGRVISDPPAFSRIFCLKTVEMSNDQGSWYTFKPDNGVMIDDPELFKSAADFCKSVMAGEAEVRYDADPARAANAEDVI